MTDTRIQRDIEIIPLVDLRIQHREVSSEVAAGWVKVMTEGTFVLGPDVEALEREFAAFSGVAHCVCVANGTDALELALRARGVGTGDEVILPANTFIATAEAVVRAGARPVLVDCDPEYLLIDPEKVADRLGRRTRAVIAVHLYGQMAPMEAVSSVVTNGVDVVEDAAHSHGASRRGRDSGSVGVIAGTGFSPGMNLGAYGDAGAVLTNDRWSADWVRALRNHGGTRKDKHELAGMSSRLDTLQAVVLRAKLRRLTAWNEERSVAAKNYDRLLGGESAIRLPATMSGNQHVWHRYVVRVPERDRVLARLQAAGVGAAVHYPGPLHRQRALSGIGYRAGDFPAAEKAADEILSLPLYPGITEAQLERVATELRTAVRLGARR
ncbi:MAG: DegT/DnrJ/EryC1/StrS family aminotransferase [Acidimicrobiales bacterium]